MWWLAAPLVIGAGKLIYDAVTEDDSSSSSYSDRDEREREARKRAKKKKREEINNKINNYKKEQILKIKEKFNVTIDIKSTKVITVYRNKTLEQKITSLKENKNEIQEAIKELESIKNETLK